MNRVFLSGTLKKQPEVVYTPRGKKLIKFPLWVDEGGFGIDVVYIGNQGTKRLAGAPGCSVIVAGQLARTSGKPQDSIRLMANKIIWMEE